MTFPVFDDGPYPASAVAQTDCDLLFISKQVIEQFCLQDPHFVRTALRLMAQRVRGHAQLVNSLSFHEVGQRLALWLLEEAERARRGANGANRASSETVEPRNRNAHRLCPGRCIASACAASATRAGNGQGASDYDSRRTRSEGVCRVFTKTCDAECQAIDLSF